MEYYYRSIRAYLLPFRKYPCWICVNIAYGMVVNMLLWNDSNIPYYSTIRCFDCRNIFFFLYMFFWRNSDLFFTIFSSVAPHRGQPAAKCHPRWQPTRRWAISCGLGKRRIRTRDCRTTVWRTTIEPPRLPNEPPRLPIEPPRLPKEPPRLPLSHHASLMSHHAIFYFLLYNILV
jgi:hypothetical protein